MSGCDRIERAAPIGESRTAKLQRIDPSRIPGYDSGEPTHAAVAAFVASGTDLEFSRYD